MGRPPEWDICCQNNSNQATTSNNAAGNATDQANQSGYKAIMALSQQSLKASGKTFNLSPGMQVAAEINQGKRTIMEYLLSPVQGVFQEAARER